MKRSVLLGVEHHSDLRSKSSGGEVLGECGPDNSDVSVLGNDLAPSDSVSCVVLDSLALEDVSAALSQIELGVFALVHALKSQQALLFVLVALATLESSEDCLSV